MSFQLLSLSVPLCRSAVVRSLLVLALFIMFLELLLGINVDQVLGLSAYLGNGSPTSFSMELRLVLHVHLREGALCVTHPPCLVHSNLEQGFEKEKC